MLACADKHKHYHHYCHYCHYRHHRCRRRSHRAKHFIGYCIGNIISWAQIIQCLVFNVQCYNWKLTRAVQFTWLNDLSIGKNKKQNKKQISGRNLVQGFLPFANLPFLRQRSIFNVLFFDSEKKCEFSSVQFPVVKLTKLCHQFFLLFFFFFSGSLTCPCTVPCHYPFSCKHCRKQFHHIAIAVVWK